MPIKTLLAGFFAGCMIASAGIYLWDRYTIDSLNRKILVLEDEVTSKKNELLGYTKYTDYLYAGKIKLDGKTKFLAAKVVRDEGITEVINKNILGIRFNAAVAIWYSAEYSFGFDLAPGSYEVTETPTGININLKKPILVSTPASSKLRHQVLNGGPFTNAQLAVIDLYEGIPARIKKNGHALASDEAIVALCEKKLVEFFQDFLSKQPGVRKVPSITVTYVQNL
jgi:hypothetical protein